MKTVQEVREQVACADINLDNLAMMVPALKDVPMFKVVKYQLACAQVDNDDDVPPPVPGGPARVL